MKGRLEAEIISKVSSSFRQLRFGNCTLQRFNFLVDFVIVPANEYNINQRTSCTSQNRANNRHPEEVIMCAEDTCSGLGKTFFFSEEGSYFSVLTDTFLLFREKKGNKKFQEKILPNPALEPYKKAEKTRGPKSRAGLIA